MSDHDRHQDRSREIKREFYSRVFLHTDYVERYLVMRGDEIMIDSNCSVIGEKILTWESCVRQKQLHDQRPRPGEKN